MYRLSDVTVSFLCVCTAWESHGALHGQRLVFSLAPPLHTRLGEHVTGLRRDLAMLDPCHAHGARNPTKPQTSCQRRPLPRHTKRATEHDKGKSARTHMLCKTTARVRASPAVRMVESAHARAQLGTGAARARARTGAGLSI